MPFGLILLYNTLITAGLLFFSPLLMLYIAAKAKRRQTFIQRMGWHRVPWTQSCNMRKIRRVWIHALSVGEVQAVAPLVNALSRTNPEADLIVTASTLTGYQTAGSLFSNSSIRLTYFPYDTIWAVRRAADMIDPTHVIIAETDLWPTFLWEMKQRQVPVYLVNLRISDRTWLRYNQFKWLAGKVYSAFAGVCVQTSKEAERLGALGIPTDRIRVAGNLKFDGSRFSNPSMLVDSWRNRLNMTSGQRIIVAGSTHEGEENAIFLALKPLLLKNSALSLIIAPRDPLRGRALHTRCRQSGLECQLLSHMIDRNNLACPQVVVVDSLGVLKELYGLADIAFVGGSMVPQGGHNPLEPASWAKPILFGNDMRDFAVIADYLLSAGAAFQVCTDDALRRSVALLLDDPYRAQVMGKRALEIFMSHQGAVDRTMSFIELG